MERAMTNKNHEIEIRKSKSNGNQLRSLRSLLESDKVVRVLEVHNAISALIAEHVVVEVGNEKRQFDAFWESSLTDSLSKGKPDIAVVDVTSRLQTVDQVREVTNRPIIFDADNGGIDEHFVFTVRSLERLGVQAVVIEDKVGQKRNSLFGTSVVQMQDDPELFAEKIRAGKAAQKSPDFMIIARIESLILGKGQDDAIHRARTYVNAGADGILIHSCQTNENEVIEFAKVFRREFPKITLVAIPTSYHTIRDKDLHAAGFNMVIYANHMMRSSIAAMTETARSILFHERASEANENCISINLAISLIDSGEKK